MFPSKTVPRPILRALRVERGHCQPSNPASARVHPNPGRRRRVLTSSLEARMRYPLTPIHCRPWLLNGLSLKLIESHYENNYGGGVGAPDTPPEKLEVLC